MWQRFVTSKEQVKTDLYIQHPSYFKYQQCDKRPVQRQCKKDGNFLTLYFYKGIYVSNIWHSMNRNSCKQYSRTKLNISFSFQHKCISATKLSLLIQVQSLACKHSRFSYLISILIDTMHDMEVNPYIATRWIAFAGLDLTMGITILRVNVVRFWISFSTCHV